MPSLSLITTTAGRAAILGAVAGPSTLVVDDAQLSNVDQSVGIGTTSLTNIVATLAATGSVRVAGSGHALHVVLIDDSTAVYDVRTIALRLDDGTFLMVYSQAGIIATKAAGSSLHLAFDLTIDADTAATLDFGDTDYALPAASESSAGVVELATSSEVDSGTDITRVMTPYQFERRASYLLGSIAILNRVIRTPDAAYVGSLNGVCYDPVLGLFVTAGSSLEVQSSPDGSAWTQETTGVGTYTGLCTNGSGLLVAVGTSGLIKSSPDASTWTTRTAAGAYPGQFNDVCYGAGLFVAVGADGEIQTSPDAVTWTQRTPGSGYVYDFFGVAYYADAGRFVAVGFGGEIQTSSDGITWTHRTSGTTDLLVGVGSNDGVVIVVGDAGRVCYSSDGLTWSTYTDAVSGSSGSGVAYGRGFFGVSAYGVGCWAVDSSGRSRRDLDHPDRQKPLYAVCFGKDSFVFVGASGAIEQAFV